MTAVDYFPATPHPTITQLAQAACGCHGCDLWQEATQTVFGAGARLAKVMLVGEEPGDHEDIEGKPFVGPAGKLLDRALAEAGIDREEAYVTNAVKHFKFERRGKRRIHRAPSRYEIGACKPWLQAELLVVKPKLVVAMGSTAVTSLLGPGVKVLANRGTVVQEGENPPVAITVHPSSNLRSRDDDERHAAFADFVRDLKSALSHVA